MPKYITQKKRLIKSIKKRKKNPDTLFFFTSYIIYLLSKFQVMVDGGVHINTSLAMHTYTYGKYMYAYESVETHLHEAR